MPSRGRSSRSRSSRSSGSMRQGGSLSFPSRSEIISQRADMYKQRAEETLDQAKRKFANTEKRVRNYINENPEKALLMAAGIGAAVGTLVTAFFRNRKLGSKRG